MHGLRVSACFGRFVNRKDGPGVRGSEGEETLAI